MVSVFGESERSEPEMFVQRSLDLEPELNTAGEQRQFEGVTEEFPPEQPERSIRVKQEEEEEADDITAVTVKTEEDEVHLSGFDLSLKEENGEDEPPDQQQLQVKTPNLEQEETGSCDFKVKEEADVVAVKSEGNEEGAEFSQLHQGVTEDCAGPGLAMNSGPYLGPDTEDETHSSETEDSADWMMPIASPSLRTVTHQAVDCEVRGNSFDKLSCSEHCETRVCKSSRKQVSTEFGTKHCNCSDCGKKCEQKLNLRQHEIAHTGEKPFICSQCGKRFKRNVTLRLHERIHTGEKPFSCSKCGQRFKRKDVLRTHEIIHTGEKPFCCSDCGQRFKRKGDLRKHERIHKGEKPFSCSDCGKGFTTKGHLRLHERIHRGEKPFGCSQCGKRFSQKCNLKTHERIHSGEKPFNCTQCGKKFRHKSCLILHERIHTGEKPFSCSGCV